jgi:hypothetical protein
MLLNNNEGGFLIMEKTFCRIKISFRAKKYQTKHKEKNVYSNHCFAFPKAKYKILEHPLTQYTSIDIDVIRPR